MAEFIVPLGFAAIGALAYLKIRRGCPCKPRATPKHKLYPHYWRNWVGRPSPAQFDHQRDDGSGHLTQSIRLGENGPTVPAGVNKGPTLHPGMVNPATGQQYDLQVHHRLVQQIANRPPAPKRQGYKRKQVKVVDFL